MAERPEPLHTKNWAPDRQILSAVLALRCAKV
jgi:hypothetical protein